MLTLGELLEQADHEDDKKLEIVIRDYEGNMHNVVGDNIMFAYSDGQIILELHGEIEDEE